MERKGDLNWTPWKTGMAFSYSGHTLMIIKQEPSDDDDGDYDMLQSNVNILKSKYRIEAHVYTNELLAIFIEMNCISDLFASLATKLMVMITGHVKSLTTSWFPKMLTSLKVQQPFVTILPCWKCCILCAQDTFYKPIHKGICTSA